MGFAAKVNPYFEKFDKPMALGGIVAVAMLGAMVMMTITNVLFTCPEQQGIENTNFASIPGNTEWLKSLIDGGAVDPCIVQVNALAAVGKYMTMGGCKFMDDAGWESWSKNDAKLANDVVLKWCDGAEATHLAKVKKLQDAFDSDPTCAAGDDAAGCKTPSPSDCGKNSAAEGFEAPFMITLKYTIRTCPSWTTAAGAAFGLKDEIEKVCTAVFAGLLIMTGIVKAKPGQQGKDATLGKVMAGVNEDRLAADAMARDMAALLKANNMLSVSDPNYVAPEGEEEKVDAKDIAADAKTIVSAV